MKRNILAKNKKIKEKWNEHQQGNFSQETIAKIDWEQFWPVKMTKFKHSVCMRERLWVGYVGFITGGSVQMTGLGRP